MPDITNVVNTILANGSTEYTSRVPLATRNNIDAVANPILTYTSVQNEFLSAIVNKIAFTLVQNKTWSNPLSLLKKGTKPLGLDIENIHTNPATASAYDATGATLLTTVTPDVKSEYFRLNRQDQYTVTIYREQLRHAFTSWENLASLIDSITNSLYSGDYIDEFILTKNTISDAVMKQKMITASVTPITSEQTAKDFVVAVKNLSSAFAYPGTAYNAWSKAGGSGTITTWTPRDKQLFIVRSDILNYLDVNVLAAAFNMDKAQFMGRVLEVDNFGSMGNILGVIMDDGAFQIHDDLSEMTEFYNAKGLYWNYFWNHWQTYALSLMANAVALVDDAVAPVAPVITAPAALDTTVSGTGVAGEIVFVTIGTETKYGIVDQAGNWTVGPFTPMVQGDTVTAYQVDEAGNKSVTDTELVTA